MAPGSVSGLGSGCILPRVQVPPGRVRRRMRTSCTRFGIVTAATWYSGCPKGCHEASNRREPLVNFRNILVGDVPRSERGLQFIMLVRLRDQVARWLGPGRLAVIGRHLQELDFGDLTPTPLPPEKPSGPRFGFSDHLDTETFPVDPGDVGDPGDAGDVGSGSSGGCTRAISACDTQCGEDGCVTGWRSAVPLKLVTRRTSRRHREQHDLSSDLDVHPHDKILSPFAI